ncbi:hypothetical protein PAMP_004263 [Pampus punctatissimus]
MKKNYTLHDALEVIMGDDSEFEGCDDSSDVDPDNPLYNPNNQDRESDDSSECGEFRAAKYIRPRKKTRNCPWTKTRNCPTEKTIVLEESVDSRVEKEESMVNVKWYDNSFVTLISSYCGVEPQDNAQRWSKADKAFVEVSRPHIVKEYNKFMSGPP